MANNMMNIDLGSERIALPTWATEETMEELIKLVSKSGKNTKDLRKTLKKLAEGQISQVEAFDRISKALEEIPEDNESIDDSMKAIKGAVTGITGAVESTKAPLSGMLNMLKSGMDASGTILSSLGKSLGDMVPSGIREKIRTGIDATADAVASTIGVAGDTVEQTHENLGNVAQTIGGVAGALIGFNAAKAEEMAEAQGKLIAAGAIISRDMVKAGSRTGGTFDMIADDLANINMSYTEFANTVANNSDVMAAAGNGVGDGAATFVQIMTAVNEKAGQFGDYGMKPDEMAETTASYMKMLKNQGILKSTLAEGEDAFAEAQHKWLVESQTLANLQGRSVEEVRAGMLKTSETAGAVAASLHYAGETALANTLTVMSDGIGSLNINEEAQDFLTSFISDSFLSAGTGIAVTGMGVEAIPALKQLGSLLDDAGDPLNDFMTKTQALAAGVKAGAITEEEAAKRSAEYVEQLQAWPKSLSEEARKKMLDSLAIFTKSADPAGQRVAAVIKSIVNAANTQSDVLAEGTEAYNHQLKETEKGFSAMGSTVAMINDARGILLHVQRALTLPMASQASAIQSISGALNETAKGLRSLVSHSMSAAQAMGDTGTQVMLDPATGKPIQVEANEFDTDWATATGAEAEQTALNAHRNNVADEFSHENLGQDLGDLEKLNPQSGHNSPNLGLPDPAAAAAEAQQTWLDETRALAKLQDSSVEEVRAEMIKMSEISATNRTIADMRPEQSVLDSAYNPEIDTTLTEVKPVEDISQIETPEIVEPKEELPPVEIPADVILSPFRMQWGWLSDLFGSDQPTADPVEPVEVEVPEPIDAGTEAMLAVLRRLEEEEKKKEEYEDGTLTRQAMALLRRQTMEIGGATVDFNRNYVVDPDSADTQKLLQMHDAFFRGNESFKKFVLDALNGAHSQMGERDWDRIFWWIEQLAEDEKKFMYAAAQRAGKTPTGKSPEMSYGTQIKNADIMDYQFFTPEGFDTKIDMEAIKKADPEFYAKMMQKQEWTANELAQDWASDMVLKEGKVPTAEELDAFIASDENQRQAALDVQWAMQEQLQQKFSDDVFKITEMGYVQGNEAYIKAQQEQQKAFLEQALDEVPVEATTPKEKSLSPTVDMQPKTSYNNYVEPRAAPVPTQVNTTAFNEGSLVPSLLANNPQVNDRSLIAELLETSKQTSKQVQNLASSVERYTLASEMSARRTA